jgi:hypothetical protein
MFEDAVADELIASNPCAVKRGGLPAKIDKDPTWRSGAVFTREEVERLIRMNEFPKSAASFTPSPKGTCVCGLRCSGARENAQSSIAVSAAKELSIADSSAQRAVGVFVSLVAAGAVSN